MTEEVFELEQPQNPGIQVMLRGLVEEIVRLERKAQEADKKSKGYKRQKDEVAQNLARKLSELGQSSVKFEDGLMVMRTVERYLSCPSEHGEEFEGWLKDKGYWSLARIPAQTIKKILKDRSANEQELPGYLRRFEKVGVQVRNKNVISRKEGDDGG